MKKILSIITVVYNCELYIEECITSVISQLNDNVEYIIIDGGSSDGTLEIIETYEDEIDILISERDNGIGNAFNKGLKCAVGEFSLFVNADDFLEPDAINNFFSVYDKMTDPNSATILYGRCNKVGPDGSFLSQKKNSKLPYFIRLPFYHAATFTSQSYFENHGVFNEDIEIAMDSELYLRGINESELIEIPLTISNQRVGGVSHINRRKGYREYAKYYGLYFKSYPLAYIGLFFKIFVAKIRKNV